MCWRRLAALMLGGCGVRAGLSYTSFTYSNLSISRAVAPNATGPAQRACLPVTVRATVANTGSMASKEVSQLYVSIGNGAPVNINSSSTATAAGSTAAAPPGPSPCWPNCKGPPARQFAVARPHAELRGATASARPLAPGASAQLVWELTARDISVVFRDGLRYVEPGMVGVHVGGSAPYGLASSGMISGAFEVPGFAPLQLDGLCPLSQRQFWHPTEAELGR